MEQLREGGVRQEESRAEENIRLGQRVAELESQLTRNSEILEEYEEKFSTRLTEQKQNIK